MSTTQEMLFAVSVPTTVSQLPDQFVAGLCALIRLNVDTCSSAATSAALHWESVLRAQTPEQFVRRQADVMPWLALQFAGYTRGWMDIASEMTRPRHSGRNHDDAHEPQADTTPARMSTCTTGVPLEVQPDDESVAEPHVRAMVRDILARVAKPTPDTPKRRSPPRARRSSTR
ncbi:MULTISPECIES: phasin family protein [Paraburkholderia]|nr:phasin family protein [Paraburkholderia podalyriae]